MAQTSVAVHSTSYVEGELLNVHCRVTRTMRYHERGAWGPCQMPPTDPPWSKWQTLHGPASAECPQALTVQQSLSSDGVSRLPEMTASNQLTSNKTTSFGTRRCSIFNTTDLISVG